MFLETVRSPGIAHLSYVIGDGALAAVIDPRLDCETYVECAAAHGARIALIYETHRNEDLVSGARALAQLTSSRGERARVLHGTALDFAYGEGAEHESEETLGNLRLRVLHTPGHTDESISIAVFDEEHAERAVGVFTGDALFVGDVGRTDFYPERAEEVAGSLYDSLFDVLLPLGDQALIWPAHGAGSVCGDAMADREFSSLGHERANNPRLQLSREEFVRAKVAEHHVQPPYFQEMERRNLQGAEPLEHNPSPPPLSASAFEAALEGGALPVDVRSPEAFAGCSIPGSLALPVGLLSGYAGWFLPYDRPLALIGESEGQVSEAALRLARMGYTRYAGFLADGLSAWVTGGRAMQSIPAVSASTLTNRLRGDDPPTVLDVRKLSEWREGHLPGAHHRFLGDLPGHDGLADLPAPVVTFCASGKRALVAASLLRRMGLDDVEVCFGSMKACKAIGCELEESD